MKCEAYYSRIVKVVCTVRAIPSSREYNLSNAIPPIIQLPERNGVFADDRSRSRIRQEEYMYSRRLSVSVQQQHVHSFTRVYSFSAYMWPIVAQVMP